MRLQAWQDLVARNPRIDQLDFVAFDTETTGFGPIDRLVEIAGVRFRGAAVQDELSLLVDPGISIPPAATRIHGITDQMVRGEWKASEAMREFFRFAEGAVWLAHNAPFDAGVFAGELYRAGVLPPEDPILDTLRQARRSMTATSYSLESLVHLLDLPAESHHRALPDSRHVYRLFGKLCARLAGDGDPALDDVMQLHGPALTLGEYMPESPELPEKFSPLREAASTDAPVVIYYQPAEGTPGYRRVTPKLFYLRRDVLYMEAFCHNSESARCYRLDRIRNFRTDS